MLDAYLSQVANEMNRVMQRLAVVERSFFRSLLTGVGMNFADQPWLKTNFWFWMAAMAFWPCSFMFGSVANAWFEFGCGTCRRF
jgi:Mg2+ and Co2+ transporter CorA